ncbi:hypothetical protein [Desmospora profundinema]|uniref:Uncharacterized protein n=1 Tax=Desmospora profundinema TaxID=1571184 RepID=A0ABU1INP0_9BACL|nr:hypothetical protein [Desmospora profundinema]MDR6226358.1 hypothetical protein [Desmospora profundinema]
MFVILFVVLWFLASAWCLMVLDQVGTQERKWSWTTLIPAVFFGGLLAIMILSLFCFLGLWLAALWLPDDAQAGKWWDWIFLSTLSILAYLLLFGLVEIALKVFLQECRLPLWLALLVQIPFLSFTLLMVSERVTVGTHLSVEAAVLVSGGLVIFGYAMERWLGFHPV